MSIKADTSFSLKDQLFNAATVGALAARITASHRGFDSEGFVTDVLKRFDELELKERIAWMVEVLAGYLPADFPTGRDILLESLPEPLDPNLNDDDFGQFIWAVPAEYVATYGCRAEHLGASLAFLREATKRFSVENAIRPFLIQFPDETLDFIRGCAGDENYHVRRLASEGIRPFLPWAPRVTLPVADVLEVLDQLHADPTRYVTRSVANTLNDLSKVDAEQVLATIQRWQQAQRQQRAELDWMTRHALRTLLKADHAGALELMGYPTNPKFRVSAISSSPMVNLGAHFEWRCTVTSQAAQRLKIALCIGFLKANGRHSSKVFAVKDVHLNEGEHVEINKRLLIKPMTTRVLYPGTHYAELVVNGVRRGKRSFELLG